MDNKNITVLLVEDNPADALLIKYTISEIEWLPVKLVSADSLAKAFTALQEHPIDLILLDLILPDSSGRSTFDKLIAFNNHIPVVILSGINSREIALEAIKEGAQDYLVKGEIDSKLLERTIRYAIERAKLLNAQKKIQQDIRDQEALLKLITKISATLLIFLPSRLTSH
jgi:response regulator of citrate/malate metabolism